MRATRSYDPEKWPLTCVVPRGSNSCLHLERLSQVNSLTRMGDGKRPLTSGFSNWLILVATPRFSMSCGIDTGSQACEGLQPPLDGSRVKRPDYRAIDQLPERRFTIRPRYPHLGMKPAHDSYRSPPHDLLGGRPATATLDGRGALQADCLPHGFVLPGRRFFAVIDRRGGSAGSARW